MNITPHDWLLALGLVILVAAALRRRRQLSAPDRGRAFKRTQYRAARPKTKGSGCLVAGAIIFAIVGLILAGPVGAVVVIVIAVVMGISRSAENTRVSANAQADILDELRRSRERADRAEAALAAQRASDREAR